MYEATRRKLAGYDIGYDKLYLLPERGCDAAAAPRELNCFERYTWQKVDYCLKNGIGAFYDDEEIVISLFQTYAPGIKAFKVGDNSAL